MEMRRQNNGIGGGDPIIDPRAFGLTKAAYTVKETLILLSIGRTKFYELVGQGDLRITKLDSKSLIFVTDIVALLIKLRGDRAEGEAAAVQGNG
jgi:hypothetical protein